MDLAWARRLEERRRAQHGLGYIRRFEPRYFGDGIAVAVPRNDPQIRSLINGALKRIRASGRFEELVQRYFPLRVY